MGTTEERRFDVVVVGGGPAGLAGAVALSRARRSVLVIDAGEPRNARAAGVHNYLGLEGVPPAELLAAGRAELLGYGGEIADGRAVSAARRDGDGFRVVLADGSAVLADRLLLATGLTDGLPEVPGIEERWGREILHCPYCHGWEVRDQAIGVLNTGPMAVEQALMWRQWSADVSLFRHTGPEPDDEQYERLAARGVAVVDGEVTGLEVTGDRLTALALAGGRLVPCRALVVFPRFAARADLLADLGLAAAEQEWGGVSLGSAVGSDPLGATGVPGVWTAGNVTTLMDTVISAAAAGVRVAAAINADLIEQDTRRAVAVRRAAGETGSGTAAAAAAR